MAVDSTHLHTPVYPASAGSAWARSPVRRCWRQRLRGAGALPAICCAAAAAACPPRARGPGGRQKSRSQAFCRLQCSAVCMRSVPGRARTGRAFEYLTCRACALCDSSRVHKTFHADAWLFLLASTFEISPRSARCTARLHPRIHVRDHARCHAHLCACLAALLRCSWYMDASGRAPLPRER